MKRRLNVRDWGLPFRIGTTSYILADELLPNAAFLAAHVQDMQLVLFEAPGGPANLPAPQDVAALAALGQARDLSYTVHLLHDLHLRDEGGALSFALAKARQVIDLTRPLQPQGWVCHLEGRDVRLEPPTATVLRAWQVETAAALEQVCSWAGDGRLVAVENLERYAPDFVMPVVERTTAGRCVDVGHLWLDGVDPLPHLAAAFARLRVVHLHGVLNGRDHVSLEHAVTSHLDAVLRYLLTQRFAGVLTLEIFGEEDFWSSFSTLEAAIVRLQSQQIT
jgi:sugar phosphate isomerase/epimerase